MNWWARHRGNWRCRPDTRCEAGDFGGSRSAFGDCFGTTFRNDFIDHLHRNDIAAEMAELLLYLLDFVVRVRVDFVELASRRVDYAGDLGDRTRHRVVDIGLLEHRDPLPQTHLVHGVDCLARVLGRQAVGELANGRGVPVECICLLGKTIANVRPCVGRGGRPQTADYRG
jgi:hypothetical protein